MMNAMTLETSFPAVTPTAPAATPVSGASDAPVFARVLAEAAGDRPVETVRGPQASNVSEASDASDASEASAASAETAPSEASGAIESLPVGRAEPTGEEGPKRDSGSKEGDSGIGDPTWAGSILGLALVAAATTASAPVSQIQSTPVKEGRGRTTGVGQGVTSGTSGAGAPPLGDPAGTVATTGTVAPAAPAKATGASDAGTPATPVIAGPTPDSGLAAQAASVPAAASTPPTYPMAPTPPTPPMTPATPTTPMAPTVTALSGAAGVGTGATGTAFRATGPNQAGQAQIAAADVSPAAAGVTAALTADGLTVGTSTGRASGDPAPRSTVEKAKDEQPSAEPQEAGQAAPPVADQEKALAGAGNAMRITLTEPGTVNAAAAPSDDVQVTVGRKARPTQDSYHAGKRAVSASPTGLATATDTTGATGTATVAAALGAGTGTGVEEKNGNGKPATGTAKAAGMTGRQGDLEGTRRAGHAVTGPLNGVSRETAGTAADRAVEQVVRSARLLGTQRLSEMRIRLDPPGMGEITLRLRAGSGEVWASAVASPETARALRDGAGSLGKALEAHGLSLASFKVTETAPGHAFTATGGHDGFAGSGWGGASDQPSDRNPGRQAPEAYSLWHRAPSGVAALASFRQAGLAALAGMRRLDRVL